MPRGCPNFTLTRKCTKIIIVNLTGDFRIIQLVHKKYGVEFVKIRGNATVFCFDYETFEVYNQGLPEIPNFKMSEQISASWKDPGYELVKISSKRYNVFEIRKKTCEPRSLWDLTMSKIFSTSRIYSQIHRLPKSLQEKLIIWERPVSFRLPSLMANRVVSVPPLIRARCNTCFCIPVNDILD